MYYPMDVDDVPAARGSRPDRLLDVSGPQERVQRRTMEQNVGCVPVVPLLDVPVPQVVDQLMEFLKHDVVQVIEVPKMSQVSIPPGKPLSEPQMVEQLVVVPVPESVLVARGTEFAGVVWCTRGRAGPTGAWRAPSTPGGNARSDSPPAQGGKQILGKAEVFADVSVNMQRKF